MVKAISNLMMCDLAVIKLHFYCVAATGHIILYEIGSCSKIQGKLSSMFIGLKVITYRLNVN